MQVVILAGGLATRLHPFTLTMPKAMLSVASKPFLQHQLALFQSAGFRDIVLCVGYLGEQIENYFGDGADFGVNLTYSWEKGELLGTGGALKKALPVLADEFFVTYGDTYLLLDYQDIASTFRKCECPGLMVVYRNEDKFDRSNVAIEDNRVLFYSKTERIPQTIYIDEGMIALRREVLDMLPDNQPVGLEIVLQHLVLEKRLYAYETRQRFYEIGSKTGLDEIRKSLLTQGTPDILE